MAREFNRKYEGISTLNVLGGVPLETLISSSIWASFVAHSMPFHFIFEKPLCESSPTKISALSHFW